MCRYTEIFLYSFTVHTSIPYKRSYNFPFFSFSVLLCTLQYKRFFPFFYIHYFAYTHVCIYYVCICVHTYTYITISLYLYIFKHYVNLVETLLSVLRYFSKRTPFYLTHSPPLIFSFKVTYSKCTENLTLTRRTGFVFM